jgi:hypothetical protein
MAWRLAKSLLRLSGEILYPYPGTTIWSIGDQAHQSGYSDHNPNGNNVVCAIDVKDNGGLILAAFVAVLLADPHPNLRYVIYKRKIYERKNGFAPHQYTGSNPHDTHVHVSVGNGPDGRSTSNYDSEAPWSLFMSPTPPKPSPPTTGWTDKLMAELPELKRGSKGAAVKRAQALLNTFGANLKEDGDFGDITHGKTREFQRAKDLAVDGIIGRKTWTRLVKG